MALLEILVAPHANYELNVNEKTHLGDSFDATTYGQLQITRPVTQPDTGHYISMVRSGNMVSGLSYVNSTNICIQKRIYSNSFI